MIRQIETIEEILPLYKDYLGCMRQFYKIYNFDAWSDTAVKNLQKHAMAEDRLLYTLKASDTIIGFALVNKHLRFNPDGLAIAEFFIQKTHQKNGCGRRLAESVFAQSPGNWEVAVTKENKGALAFWNQVISSYTGKFKKKRIPSFNGYGFLFNNE